jgi:hypothetical protein
MVSRRGTFHQVGREGRPAALAPGHLVHAGQRPPPAKHLDQLRTDSQGEFARNRAGSHRGVEYDGTSYFDPSDPGDALVFHCGTLHGGAPVAPACPTRHTLVLRFFGDKLFYRLLPDKRANFGADASALNDPSLTPGDRYRSSYYAQLR